MKNFLLIHNAGGSSEMMRYTAEYFARNGKKLNPDLLGRGSSEKPEAAYGLELFAKELIELCKREKRDRVPGPILKFPLKSIR